MASTEKYFQDLGTYTQGMRDAAEPKPKKAAPSKPVRKADTPPSDGYMIYRDKDLDYMQGEQDKISKKMLPKVPSYKKGTKFVPKTGPAKIHKGEVVLSKGMAKHYRGAAGALGAGKKRPARKRK